MSNSFDVYETVIFPILGGVIAGFIVVVIELVFRHLYDRWQRSKAINAIEKLLGEWESKINNANDLTDDHGRIIQTKEVIRFLHHKYYLKRVPIAIAAWSKNLSEEQTDELTVLIVQNEHVLEGIVRPGMVPDKTPYDDLFRKAREIKWLKF